MTSEKALLETHLPDLTLWRRGKVRDVYEFGDDLLFIATDRISAFDVVMPNGIPGRGAILTQLSAFWFRHFTDMVRHHMITADVEAFPERLQPYREQLAGRSMLVRRTEPVMVECVVRGYLAGSGWKDYQRDQAICGVALPPGLRESAKFLEPIFTPSTKTEGGHDLPMSFDEVVKLLGDRTLAERLRDVSLSLYTAAAARVAKNGLILSDTKFEFGLLNGELVLIDEALTPDSSRYWLQAEYEPGRSQMAFDKQFVRDYLEGLDWDKTAPGPELPPEIVAGALERYLQVYEQITGEQFTTREMALHG